MIDGHIHYAQSMKEERLLQLIEQYRYAGIALQCIPKGYIEPVEEDAFSFREHCYVPVYIFGNLNLTWENGETGEEPVRIAKELMQRGCTGIKMLEGKPNMRRRFPIPDFDSEKWEPYWAYLEQEQIPVYMHVNDPPQFWNAGLVSEFARNAGWFYDESYINNEEQYRQMEQVLERHPNLRILFPHFYFLSGDLERLGNLLDRFKGMYLDVTPCVELFLDLSEQGKKAKYFFEKYKERICYGTDIGARSVIYEEDVPLSVEECQDRIKLITMFLEIEDEYVLEPNHYYHGPRVCCMHGLGLSKEMLDLIYEKNFLRFISR